MIEGIVFYLFALSLLFSGVMTVTARNPVTAVLFLILAFTSGAGLFILLAAEFLAFILVIVYVGALAVLFLFVVMMLHVKAQEQKQILRRELPVALTIGAVLLAQMMTVILAWPMAKVAPVIDKPPVIDNTRALGQVLYTDYAYAFQLCGVALLVAMIGAIVLTLHERRFVKRQKLSDQLYVDARDVVELRNVKTGEGAS